MDMADIVKLGALFFGSTGAFILYVKYRVLSKTGPLNGAVASIDRIEGIVKEDHDLLTRVEGKVEYLDGEVDKLRDFRHEFGNTVGRVETKVGHLSEDLTKFTAAHQAEERARARVLEMEMERERERS